MLIFLANCKVILLFNLHHTTQNTYYKVIMMGWNTDFPIFQIFRMKAEALKVLFYTDFKKDHATKYNDS